MRVELPKSLKAAKTCRIIPKAFIIVPFGRYLRRSVFGRFPSCNKSIFFFPLKVNTVGKGAALCGKNDIKTAAISAKIQTAGQFLINIRKKNRKKITKKEIKAKSTANAVVGQNNVFARLSVVIYAANGSGGTPPLGTLTRSAFK